MTGRPTAPEATQPSARPPWRTIALLIIVGAGLIGLGAATRQPWLALLGIPPLACAPSALLVPAFRISRHRRPQNGFRDMSFIGGWMATWGFTAAERDAALTRRASRSEGPPPAP